jgi:2,3-bisphosphoglycerate-dependent phosphoglycerate mutase
MTAFPNRIWLVRHAITTAPNVLNGAESNVPLSELGHHQAGALAGWFKGLAPEVVYSSTMTRAIQTAQPIAAMCGVPHHIAEDLHERRIGALCGQEFSLNVGPWADTLNAWADGNTAYTTPGAESYCDLVARLLPAWNRVMQQASGKRAVIVVHGIVVKVLLLTLLANHGPRKWTTLGRVQNVSVTELLQIGTEIRANSLLYVPEAVQNLNVREHEPVRHSVG